MTLLPNWKVKSPVTNLAEQKMAQPCKGHSLERMLMKWVASMSTKKEVSVEHFLQETGINKSFHIATYPRLRVGIFLFKTEKGQLIFSSVLTFSFLQIRFQPALPQYTTRAFAAAPFYSVVAGVSVLADVIECTELICQCPSVFFI